MSPFIIAIAFALFLWWFSTGLVLLANRLTNVGTVVAMVVASAAALAAIIGLWIIRDSQTVSSAYLGFLAGLLVWAWHEVAFLSGVLTGPRSTECPKGATGLRRFVVATETLIHHEIAIAITVLGLFWMLSDAANQIGLWTFLILWGMRLSAKFNIFLGVPNITEEFLPSQLGHLRSYFKIQPLNGLFPVSITVSTGLMFWLAHHAIGAEASAFTVAGFTLLTTLTALGIVEHWFLVLPLRDQDLWRWYLKDRKPTNEVGTARSAYPRTKRGDITGQDQTTTPAVAGLHGGAAGGPGKPASSFHSHDQHGLHVPKAIGGPRS